MAQQIKRRQHMRYPVSLTVTVQTAGWRRFGTMYDVSRGGAFIGLDSPPAAGTTVSIALAFEDGAALTLRGEVKHAHVDDPRKLVSGFGMEFQAVAGEDERRLVHVLDRARKGENPRAP